MSRDLSVPAAKAFSYLHLDNPLNKFNDRDRTYLYALLLIYARESTDLRKGKTADDPLEKVFMVMADAAKLAAQLESDVFQGHYSDVLRPYIAEYEALPKQLVRLSKRLGNLLATVGKRGHMRETWANQFLVQASEFVRLKTGQHYDEHLTELLQGIGKRSWVEDLSGDAIRKKRKYAKKHYPELYADALKRSKRAL